jgi:oligopeptide transport system permease protein
VIRFVAGRLLGGLAVIAAVATACFFLLHAAPGGPFDGEARMAPEIRRNLEDHYHLRDPLWRQYAAYMAGLARGDLGPSIKRPQTVNELIAAHVAVSATIGLCALGIAIGLGLAIGVAAARRHGRWPDRGLMTLALIGISVPSFVLGPMLVAVIAIRLGWLPPVRIDGPSGYVLPAITLGLIYTGAIARLTRAGLLDVLGQDYVRTARAKGLAERAVVWRHALRLGVVPAVSYLGPAAAALISGSIVVEKIFEVPGLGFYFVASIVDRDYPVLTGVFVFYVAIVVALNLVVDLVHGWLDPRLARASSR